VNRRSLKSGGAAPSGSAPGDEAIHSHPARQDVNDIWDYIAGDNIEAADRVLEALRRCNAQAGETKPLQIIRVLHAARDVQGILGLSPDEP
jgi:plasmid stabilization system protein ParE